MGGSQQDDRADAVIAALAASQHGVVSRSQLLSAGITRRQIERRLEAKRLHIVHRCVYAVGHESLPQEAIWMAAALAGGSRASLSHWSAAVLLRLREGGGPRTHVTSPRARRNTETIVFHEATLPDDEVTTVHGIPTTTRARAALDLAPLLPSPSLARMIAAIGAQPGPSLADLLERYPRKPGVPKLRGLLTRPIPMTRSDLEAKWLARIEAAGLPRPRVNSVVEGYEVDLAWPERRVIAEVDSYVTHGSALAFEVDRTRDRRLAAAGWHVVRLTDRAGDDALDDLSRLLAASAARSRAAA